MKMQQKQPINFLDALQLLFIAARLFHQNDWPWHVVLIPTWVSFVCLVLASLAEDSKK